MLALLVAATLLSDTLDVAPLARTPVLDGRVDAAEYGAPTLRLTTPVGEVQLWVGRREGAVYIAATFPDSTYYWGDDLVVSVDPDGSGGTAPGAGDRQWYMRRLVDSSVVLTPENGRWWAPDRGITPLGATRRGADWEVASTSSATGWMIELRIQEAAIKPTAAPPRIAIRTYNDKPHGWWSWPAPPAGLPPQRVEQRPELWAIARMRQADAR